MPDPHTGAESEVEIHRLLVAVLVRGALYSTEASSLLPLLIERAHSGDFRPLVAMGASWERVESLMSQGLSLSVVCSEDVAMISQEDRERALSDSFFRAELLDLLKEACGPKESCLKVITIRLSLICPCCCFLANSIR